MFDGGELVGVWVEAPFHFVRANQRGAFGEVLLNCGGVFAKGGAHDPAVDFVFFCVGEGLGIHPGDGGFAVVLEDVFDLVREFGADEEEEGAEEEDEGEKDNEDRFEQGDVFVALHEPVDDWIKEVGDDASNGEGD